MPYKNTAITVTFIAWDTILNVGKTGDDGNFTLRGVGDGTEYTPADTAHEVDATNLPGVYKVAIALGENNVSFNMLGGKSATANISIIPVSWSNESDSAVKSQDNIDFGALQKASITAAVPTVVQVQDGLAPASEYDTEMAHLDVDVSTRTKPADTLARVTLVDTVTENTDMRGTNDAGTAINLAIVDTVVDAIKLKTDNLPSGIAKNVALSNFEFLMIDATDHVSAKTGLTITAQISKDGGAFAACTNSAIEISNGLYKINLTQAEMNVDIITLKFTATGADQRTITIITS